MLPGEIRKFYCKYINYISAPATRLIKYWYFKFSFKKFIQRFLQKYLNFDFCFFLKYQIKYKFYMI